MRQLQVQQIGNGKMMRTALLNVDDVAKDLKVPADYLPTFLAYTLGGKANYDGKKPDRERGSVSGHHPLDQVIFFSKRKNGLFSWVFELIFWIIFF